MLDLAFISGPDMAIVLVVALIVFGPKRLPEVGRQVGGLLRDLKKMSSEFTDVVHGTANEIHPAITSQFQPGTTYKPATGPVDVEPLHVPEAETVPPDLMEPSPRLALASGAETGATRSEHALDPTPRQEGN